MKAEQERVKQVIANAVTLMCKNGIQFQKEMRIEAVIGITIDSDDVMLVHINERVDTDAKGLTGVSSQQDDVTNLSTDPSSVIGDITEKVFTKVDTSNTVKETTPKGKNNRVTKAPAKRAPTKRGRKQKLIPLTNGDINEKVITDGVTTVGETVKKPCVERQIKKAGSERKGYDIEIKSEPPDLVVSGLNHNGIELDVTGDGKVNNKVENTIHSTKSDDDTLVMQQSYVSPLSIDLSLSDQLQPDKIYSPPCKRKQLNSDQETLVSGVFVPSSGSSTQGKTDDDSLSQRVSSLSPSWPPNVSTTTTDEGTSSPGHQKPSVGDASSTWCSPAQSKARSRRPSNGLQSTAVKRMLSEYLVEPIAQTDCKVCTFRLMWHGSVTEAEHVWSQLPYYQEAIDRIITEPAQVALAVSAVTATSTRPKSGTVKAEAASITNGTTPANPPDKFRTFPGLAYWIVLQNEADFTETDLYNRIYENCFGARLKSLSDQAVASDLQEMCSTLYLVVKDNVDGYVRWKLDAVLPTNSDSEVNFQPVVKVYARAEQDFNTLLMAREALQKNRFYFSLLKSDV